MNKYYPLKINRRDDGTIISIYALDRETGAVEVFNQLNIGKLAKNCSFDFKLKNYTGSAVAPSNNEYSVVVFDNTVDGQRYYGVVKFDSMDGKKLGIRLEWYTDINKVMSVVSNTRDIAEGLDKRELFGDIKEGYYGKGVRYNGIAASHRYTNKVAQPEVSKTVESNTQGIEKDTVDAISDAVVNKLKEAFSKENELKELENRLIEKENELKRYENELKDIEASMLIQRGGANNLEIKAGNVCCVQKNYEYDAEKEIYDLILKRMKVGDSITIPNSLYSKYRVLLEDKALKTNIKHTRCTYLASIEIDGKYVGCMTVTNEDEPVRIVVLKECSYSRIDRSEIDKYTKMYVSWRVNSEAASVI